MDYSKEKKMICERYGSLFVDSPESSKVGISRNVKDDFWSINGMRHPIEGDTSGWYIWGGEVLSTDPDFFVPLHDWNPGILKYLGLAPGWRFLVTEN